MEEKIKKIILPAIGIVVVLVLAGFFYYLSLPKEKLAPPSPGKTKAQQELEAIEKLRKEYGATTFSIEVVESQLNEIENLRKMAK
jgi:hypothetical protein